MHDICKIDLNENKISQIKIAGIISFLKTTWRQISSTDEYKNQVLGNFVDTNFSNDANSQLDVVLTNEPEPIIHCSFDLKVFLSCSLDKKPCSDQKLIGLN